MGYRLNIECYIKLLKKKVVSIIKKNHYSLKIKRNFWNYFLMAHMWKVKFPMIEKYIPFVNRRISN